MISTAILWQDTTLLQYAVTLSSHSLAGCQHYCCSQGGAHVAHTSSHQYVRYVSIACQVCLHLQVSPSGRFVATFFMKTVFVYSTERPALPPLKLYHTREITVCPLMQLLTGTCYACLLRLHANSTSTSKRCHHWDGGAPFSYTGHNCILYLCTASQVQQDSAEFSGGPNNTCISMHNQWHAMLSFKVRKNSKYLHVTTGASVLRSSLLSILSLHI